MHPPLHLRRAVPGHTARQLGMLLLATCVIAGSAGAVDPSTPAAMPIAAKWVPRQLHFMYSAISPSFKTTYYSCDALQQKMTSILRQLGAGQDLVVKPAGCIRPTGPDRFPGVDATFSVLEPVGAGRQGTAHSQDVTAHWDKVSLDSDDASCALIEQVKRNVLPLFSSRNPSSGCSPDFSVEVLRPVKPPVPASAPR